MKKATRFMRKPFFVDGHKVTEEDMEFVAQWCQGTIIIPEKGLPFIRVPVIGAKSSRQSEAHMGMWVLRSLQGGKDTYKIYSEDWLMKSFDRIPGDDEPEESDTEERKVSNNVRELRPTPAMFGQRRSDIM